MHSGQTCVITASLNEHPFCITGIRLLLGEYHRKEERPVVIVVHRLATDGALDCDLGDVSVMPLTIFQLSLKLGKVCTSGGR